MCLRQWAHTEPRGILVCVQPSSYISHLTYNIARGKISGTKKYQKTTTKCIKKEKKNTQTHSYTRGSTGDTVLWYPFLDALRMDCYAWSCPFPSRTRQSDICRKTWQRQTCIAASSISVYSQCHLLPPKSSLQQTLRFVKRRCPHSTFSQRVSLGGTGKN